MPDKAKPAAAADDLGDLDDFLGELDAELTPTKRTKGSGPKRKAQATKDWNDLPRIEVQWHPAGIEYMVHDQTCAGCGAEFQLVQGLYLIDMTANGARRAVRHNPALPLPASHAKFPVETTLGTEETLPCCPWCYKSRDQSLGTKPTLPEHRHESDDTAQQITEARSA